jgi:KipI family sensor histidine kinase inhibitor
VSAPRVVPFGDRALLVATDDVRDAHAVAAGIDARRAGRGDPPPGAIEEVVVGFASVLVALAPGPEADDVDGVASWLGRVARASVGTGPVGTGSATHVLPVVFDGADLADVASAVGMPAERVVDLVVGADLEVAFVGFAPGFPYLTGLPDALAALPRRSTPRTTVPAGSMAVAGGFAAVYPSSTPGGWHLLGRTSVPLFDPRRRPHARMAPGDRVRFVVADATAPGPRSAVDGRPLLDSGDAPHLEVLEPGLVSAVQDAGRVGVAAIGVPRAGAADPRSLDLVNLLLGNGPGAAAVECTVSGPTVRVAGDGHVSVVGAAAGAVAVSVDGRPVPDGTVVPVRDGQVVRVGRIARGVRAYLGVAGGLVTPSLFGSRASDALTGLGPGRLRTGDRLARGTPGRARGSLHLPDPGPGGGPVVLRVVPGPHALGPDGSDDAAFARLVAARWTAGADGDRVGMRLTPVGGDRHTPPVPVASTPVVTGAVQVPPDGRPIVLLPDHATVGGYPVVACVIAADLPLLGQLGPGDAVALVPVDAAGAGEALARSRAARDAAVSGWFPTAAGA